VHADSIRRVIAYISVAGLPTHDGLEGWDDSQLRHGLQETVLHLNILKQWLTQTTQPVHEGAYGLLMAKINHWSLLFGCETQGILVSKISAHDYLESVTVDDGVKDIQRVDPFLLHMLEESELAGRSYTFQHYTSKHSPSCYSKSHAPQKASLVRLSCTYAWPYAFSWPQRGLGQCG